MGKHRKAQGWRNEARKNVSVHVLQKRGCEVGINRAMKAEEK